MRIAAVVADLAADLADLGALGDEATADAARRLAAAMQGPMTARLLEILGQAAAELDASLPGGHVEVRLVGGDAELVVVDRGAPEETPEIELEGETDARITLRLPSPLKLRLEAASGREGVSLNAYIVRVLGNQSRGDRSPKVGRRMSGYGRS
jgi:hypothetical protein